VANKWEDMRSETTIDDIGAYLMANVAQGLYTGPEIIREYIQNARDSYVDLRKLLAAALPNTNPSERIVPSNEIRVDVRGKSIFIFDQGIGMGYKEIEKAKKIALPSKQLNDPEYVGFRKLGIWSGLAACKQLIVESSKYNEPYKYRMTINCENISRDVVKPISIKTLLDPNIKIQRIEEKKEEHYTQVELQDISPQYDELLDLERLKQVIIDHCPVHFAPSFDGDRKIESKLKKKGVDFYRIYVRGTEVFRDFPSRVSQPEWEPIKVGSKIVAWAWYCLNEGSGQLDTENGNQRRNISLRIKNFAVGERGIYSINDDYSRQQGFVTIDSPENLNWYAGEVHILDTKIIPDTPRRRLEDDAHSRKFIGKLREFYAGITSATRVHSTYISGQKHIADAKKALEELKKGESEKRRNTLSKVFALLETDEKKSVGDSKSKLSQEQARVLATDELREPRQDLLKEIAKALKGGGPSNKSQKGSKKAASTRDGSPNTTASASNGESTDKTQLRELIANPEELFQSITRIIGDVLGEDSSEYKEVSKQIEKLFEREGLF
jgi:molecular chaperone HtpG